MKRGRFFLRAVRQVLLSVILFALFFQLFSVIQIMLEYEYQYTDAMNKLSGIEAQRNRGIAQIENRLSIHLQRRERMLGVLDMLLDDGQPVDLEVVKPLIGLEALAIVDAQNHVVDGDPLDEYSIDCDDLLAQCREQSADSDAGIQLVMGNELSQMMFASELRSGQILIGVPQGEELDAQVDAGLTRLLSLKQYTFGEHGLMVGFKRETGEPVYLPERMPDGCTADMLIDRAKKDGIVWLGSEVYQVITQDSSNDIQFAAMISVGDICAKRFKTTVVYALAFTLCVMLLYWYEGFLREDERRGRLKSRARRSFLGVAYNPDAVRRMARTALCLFAVLAVFCYYLETFTSASGHRINHAQRLGMLEQSMQAQQQEMELEARAYDEDLVRMARMAALALEAEPTLCTPEGMARLADTLQVDSVYVFDREGRTVATNTVFADFELSRQEGDQSFAFWNVVRGYDEVCVQSTEQDDSAWHREMQYVGVARKDAPGMVQLGIVPDEYRKSLSLPLLSVIADMPAQGDGAFYCVVDADGLVQGWPDETYNGGSPQRLGLTETEMRDGYSGYQWLADKQHFLTCRKIGEEYVFTVIPKSSVFGYDAAAAWFSFLGGILIIGLLSLLLLAWRAIFARLSGRNGRRKHGEPQAASGGSFKAGEGFRRKNADEKLEALLRFFAGMAVLAVFMYYRWIDTQQESDSMLEYILSRKWEYSVNVFALTYVLWIVSSVYMISKMLCRAIRWMMGIMSTRTRTIGTLLSNIIEYGAAIGALFYCLPLIGFNPAAIVATASFISFALTFGAQELIKDFLSGMFIIFEDSLRVGDRVNIAGSEGYIEQIGLRMTTMVLEDGNALVIHNSAVNQFIRKLHLATVRVEAENPAAVDKIRRVLLDELHRFRTGIDRMIAEPYLERREEKEGVVLVCAQCRKEDVEAVSFELGSAVRRALVSGGVEGWSIPEEQ